PCQGEVLWLCGNAGATGFYRVAYDDAALARLSKHLPALEPAERMGLVGDQWALVWSGRREISGFLDLAERATADPDYAVLDELVSRLGTIEQTLLPEAERPRFRRFVEGAFGSAFVELGWDAASEEADGARLRRAALLRAVGTLARSSEVVAEAKARLA